MQSQEDITNCYNLTAKNYADKFIDELSKKHLDRILLKAFAEENKSKGRCIDLGCGPGQTTKFLFENGYTDILGTDISPEMIAVAKAIHPHLNFETADMLALNYPANFFASAIAFYSIVHFTHEQIQTAFREVKRILKPGGHFLFSFHIGSGAVHLDEFLDHKVSIGFYFFDTVAITDLLTASGFKITDIIERTPYKDVEYPSRRAYIWAECGN